VRVLLVGGCGALGANLAPLLAARGDEAVVFDVADPPEALGAARFARGSVLDRGALLAAMAGVDVVVHIAAWHGIHESAGRRDAFEFWDLNMTGTMNALESAARAGVANVVYVSSTSVRIAESFYGETKRLGERLVAWYAAHRGTNAVVLRPRAFIPAGDRAVYPAFADWAKWFWRGAVHVADVADATMRAADTLVRTRFAEPPVLVVDGADDIPDAERAAWDANGPGTSLRRVYPEYADAALAAGLDATRPPTRLDIAETRRVLGYQPAYGVREMLRELAERTGD